MKHIITSPDCGLPERPKGHVIEVEISEVDILIIKCKMGPRNTESVLYALGSSLETDQYGRVYPVADFKVMSKKQYENNV